MAWLEAFRCLYSWDMFSAGVTNHSGLWVRTNQQAFVTWAVLKYFKYNYRQHDRKMFCDYSYMWEPDWEMHLDTKMLKYKEHFCGWWEKLETHLMFRLAWKPGTHGCQRTGPFSAFFWAVATWKWDKNREDSLTNFA